MQVASTTWHASLHVADDDMKVFLVLEPRADAGSATPPTLEALHADLRDLGVTVPIDEELVLRLLTDPVAVCALIASATPPRPGRAGRIEWLIHDHGEDAPRERDDGSVDYRERNPWVHVEPNTPLAVVLPPGEGHDGWDVYGQRRTAAEGRPLRVQAGRGAVLIGPDTDPEALDPAAREAALAALAGIEPSEGAVVCVALDAGRPVITTRGPHDVIVEVRPLLDIRGDVGLATGHVRFQGDVAVHGNVDAAMIVEAGGEVIVHGSVDRAEIRAGKNVTIRGGIFQSRIQAGAGARLYFVNQSQVTAGEYIEIGPRGAYLATLDAPTVTVRGPLVGGEVRVVDRLQAAEVGSEMGARTVLVAPAGGELRARTMHPQVMVRVGGRSLILTETRSHVRCRLQEGRLVF